MFLRLMGSSKDSLKRKLELLFMLVLRSGRTILMAVLLIFGPSDAFYMKCAVLSLLSRGKISTNCTTECKGHIIHPYPANTLAIFSNSSNPACN